MIWYKFDIMQYKQFDYDFCLYIYQQTTTMFGVEPNI